MNAAPRFKLGEYVVVNGRGGGIVTSVRKQYPGHDVEGQDVYGVVFQSRCTRCGSPRTEYASAFDMHVRRPA
jgi:hypothetical protein